jgi:hypothetical protein
MRKKISQRAPWKAQLDEARALNDKEQSLTKRELGLLVVAMMEDVIDALHAGDYEALRKCAEDIKEIRERLGGMDSPDPSPEQAFDKLEELVTTYRWPFPLAKDFAKSMLKPSPRRKGAPLNARVRSIEARDLRQMTPRKSWLEIAKTKDVCDCGKPQHDEHCADRIRSGVRDLNKFIGSMTGRR